MTEVIMPKMGDGMEEGTLLEWLKKDGDSVKSGEVIGTIQTDKATLELEAPGSGKLTGILLEPGGTVPVGKPIAAIVKDGEQLPSGWGSGAPVKQDAAPAPEAPASTPVEAEAVGQTPSTNGKSSEQVAQEVKAGEPAKTVERVKASPLARKVAKEKGIELSAVKGTGPGGRIVQRDVTEVKPAEPSAPAPEKVSAPTPGDKTIALPRLRQITAKRTTESKQQVPHFYVTVEVDVERILQLREMFSAENGGKISIND